MKNKLRVEELNGEKSGVVLHGASSQPRSYKKEKQQMHVKDTYGIEMQYCTVHLHYTLYTCCTPQGFILGADAMQTCSTRAPPPSASKMHSLPPHHFIPPHHLVNFIHFLLLSHSCEAKSE